MARPRNPAAFDLNQFFRGVPTYTARHVEGPVSAIGHRPSAFDQRAGIALILTKGIA